ncbi:MAG: diguanylate cyclase [bacterium]|nr:diguanylate cyclase [bacterium]
MKKQKTNPLKIGLLIIAGALIAVAITGAFYRTNDPEPAAWPATPGILWAVILAAVYATLIWRTVSRESRQRWQLWTLLLLTAVTVMAVQQTGGLNSPWLFTYLLLTLLSLYRAEEKWQFLAPAVLLLTEGGSAWFHQMIPGPALYRLGGLLLFLASAFTVGRLLLKRSFSPAQNQEDEPEREAVAPSSELKHDLQSLASLMHASLGAKTAAFFRLDPSANYLKLAACRSYSAEIIKEAALDAQKGILGWVVKEKQALLYPVFSKDSKDLGYYAKSEPLKSLLAVPIIMENRVEGIAVADSEEENHFNESSKALLAGFAEEAARLMILHQSHSALGLEGERLKEWNRYLEQMANRLRVDEVIEIMGKLIPELVSCEHLVLLQAPESGDVCRVLLAEPAAAGFPAPGTELDISGTLCEQAVRILEWRKVDDFYRRSLGLFRFSREERQDHGFRSVLAAPLTYEGVCHYILVLESRKPYAFEAEAETLHILLSQFSLALRSAALYQEKEQMAIRDGLTGLANHRRFQDYLAETLAKSDGKPVGVALFDIDFFKKLNDNYGHPIGDAVLKEVAARLKANTSKYDFVARYGGEEFIAVWPGRTDKEAEVLAEGLRQAIGNEKFSTTAGELPVTVSLGVASYPQDSNNKPDLIKAADEALYAAKKAGRNRVVRYSAMPKA